MSKPYIPQDWYWLATDGRLYSSSRQSIVPALDETYIGWMADGTRPTAWPRDEDGRQTNASLQDVLTPFGLFASLPAYAADARFRTETGGIVVAGVPIATDDRSKTMLLGARIAATADPAFTTSWVAADGVSRQFGASEVVAVSDAVLAHVAACFRVYGEVLAAAAAVPATITTKAQVDAAFAAIAN